MSQLIRTAISSPETLATGMITVFGLLLCYISYLFFLAPLHQIPGPVLARVSRLWDLYVVIRGDSVETYAKLHEKHGPVIRIGPNKYSFNTLTDTKAIYALQAGFVKTTYYSTFGDRPNIFNTQDVQLHAQRRRPIAGLYTMSNTVHYEPAVDKVTALCISKLRAFAKSRKLISIPTYMHYYAFDVIAQISLDKSFGMLEHGEDRNGILTAVDSNVKLGARFGVFPELFPWFVKLVNLYRTRNPGTAITEFVMSNISAAREAKAQSMSGDVVDATNTLSGDQKAQSFIYKCLDLISQDKMKFESSFFACNANIAAGSSTTGITISAILFHLYKNPETLRRLRTELDQAAAEARISRPITFGESQRLPYLQAVIKEGLRLHPAISGILPRKVPDGGAQLAGYWFPAGSEVGTSAYVLHQNRRVYGEDCHLWRPERWLDGSDQEGGNEITSNFTFGSGSRECLGKNISLLEISKLVPEIVIELDLQFKRPGSEAKTQTAFFRWIEYECFVEERHSGQDIRVSK